MKLTKSVTTIGANHPDRKLFDAFVPLPYGTTYNAYLVEGSEKTALIDTVDPEKTDVLLKNIKGKKIDFIISNHAEQDHSGSIPTILKLHPDAKVICTNMGKTMLQSLLPIPDEKIIVIKDKETLSLGDKTLEFIYTPWVHWPETMCTYLVEDNILFSCDLFGSHEGTDTLEVTKKTLPGAKLYYAQIMMPYARFIVKHLEKLAPYTINTIAPSHGPIWKNPSDIINPYKEWVSEKTENKVIILYATMHNSTEKIAHYLKIKLEEQGIPVSMINAVGGDMGELAVELIDAATLIIATPTFINGPHPDIIYASYVINGFNPKTKYLGIIGTYGWAKTLPAILQPLLKGMQAERFEPLLIHGHGTKKEYEKLTALVDTIKTKHASL